MTDAECVALLQWAAPRLRLRWEGFRRVRGQVCKRIGRRLKELGLADVAAYRAHLERDAAEWDVLDALCRVTISRFYRDRGIFGALLDALPGLLRDAQARGETALRVWSAGCASGEEPYTVAILYRLGLQHRFPGMGLEVVATDADAHLLERARAGCYRSATLRELPKEWSAQAFEARGDAWCVTAPFREGITFQQEDLRARMPPGPFHVVLCRNVAFTYFAREPLQREVLTGLVGRLVPGGLLVIGAHESLPGPAEDAGLIHVSGAYSVFRKRLTV
ncbi:CheR family methyltransferase [Myxococcaceae bacterium GXIMD 01537]